MHADHAARVRRREPRPEARWTLALEIRREAAGPVLAVERVEPEDLDEVRGELWRETCLRRGLPDVPLESLAVRVEPVASGRAPARPDGYALEIESGVAGGRRCVFGVRSLHHVAARSIQRLVANGVLRESDLCTYEISAHREAVISPRPVAPDDVPFRTTASPRPLDLLRLPLASLRGAARAVETGMAPPEAAEAPYPVFYTVAALAAAERIARRGQRRHPPVETGGVLVGPLGVCPETHELFAVVTDVIEAVGAEEGAHSLAYSGRTWQRIESVVRAIRARDGYAAYRPLGQVHGHNFLPADGALPCAHCAHSSICSRTSVFVSAADTEWSHAVFCRQPWKLCHIFGLNARGQSVHGLFGLDDGRLRHRVLRVIDGFDPRQGATDGNTTHPTTDETRTT